PWRASPTAPPSRRSTAWPNGSRRRSAAPSPPPRSARRSPATRSSASSPASRSRTWTSVCSRSSSGSGWPPPPRPLRPRCPVATPGTAWRPAPTSSSRHTSTRRTARSRTRSWRIGPDPSMSRSTSTVVAGSIFAVLLLLFLYSVAEVLLLLFISVLFSLYLGAITDTLQRRLRLPRGIGLFLAVLVTALGLVGVAYLIVPPVTEQTQELLQALPRELERWEAWLLALAERSPLAIQLLGPLQEGQSYVGNILQEIGGYFRGMVPYVFSGVQFLIHVVSVFVM